MISHQKRTANIHTARKGQNGICVSKATFFSFIQRIFFI
jgi:hypothetical protein